jgi:hypothetical protein
MEHLLHTKCWIDRIFTYQYASFYDVVMVFVDHVYRYHLYFLYCCYGWGTMIQQRSKLLCGNEYFGPK